MISSLGEFLCTENAAQLIPQEAGGRRGLSAVQNRLQFLPFPASSLCLVGGILALLLVTEVMLKLPWKRT